MQHAPNERLVASEQVRTKRRSTNLAEVAVGLAPDRVSLRVQVQDDHLVVRNSSEIGLNGSCEGLVCCDKAAADDWSRSPIKRAAETIINTVAGCKNTHPTLHQPDGLRVRVSHRPDHRSAAGSQVLGLIARRIHLVKGVTVVDICRISVFLSEVQSAHGPFRILR